MRLLSQLFSTLGLLALAAAVIVMPEGQPDGSTELRWGYLFLGLAGCAVCFVIAAWIAPRDDDRRK